MKVVYIFFEPFYPKRNKIFAKYGVALRLEKYQTLIVVPPQPSLCATTKTGNIAAILIYLTPVINGKG